MTTKAKTNKTKKKPNSKRNPDEFKIIKITDIKPSATNPRKIFDSESLNELADSIASQGILENLLVRRKGKKYELIAGERRLRASRLAKLKEVPCMVKDVSDEDVLEIQIIENLQRKDVEPMDEAVGYKNILDKGKLTIYDLSKKVGKAETFIAERITLNKLIESGQKDLADGYLPIGHALEIAKLPADVQEVVMSNLVYDYSRNRENGHVTYKSLLHRIERDILLNLKKAPFSLKSEDLTTYHWQDSDGKIPSELDDDLRSRLLFLMLYAHEGIIYKNNTDYRSQAEIKKLAEEFDIKYAELDARERLAQSPKKHKDLFRDYLNRVEAGETPKIPRIYSDKYKKED